MAKSLRTSDGGNRIQLSTRGNGSNNGELNNPNSTRRFNRNLALLARQMVPPELLIEYHLAVLQDHNPFIVRDERYKDGWKVEWDDRKTRELPTLADKTASIKFLREAGWGMPAQAHYVDMDVRASGRDSGVDLAPIADDPMTLHRVAEAVRLALEAPGQASVLPASPGSAQRVLDAVSTEVLDGPPDPGVAPCE